MAGGDVVEFRFQATSGPQKKSRDSVGGAEVVQRTPTWWSSSPASSMTNGYCKSSTEKTSIGRTGVNITSGI